MCQTFEQRKCTKEVKTEVETDSKCSYKCEGMNIISYNEFEINSKKLIKNISNLSEMYGRYKETYKKFPNKLGKN